MKFFFLRHTTLKVDDDVFYGQTDLNVSDNFEEELLTIKEKLLCNIKNFNTISIYASPLKRCAKLAENLSDKVCYDKRVMELNLGDWEMKKKKSIPTQLINEWEKNILTFQIPNGENNKSFLLRLKNFVSDLRKKQKDVLIVAHAGSINGMISILTGQPFDKLLKNYWEKITHGSLSLVELKEGIVKIKFIGK